jgi:hypothetical protein
MVKPAIHTGLASPRRSVCKPGSILMVSQTAFYPKEGTTMEPRKIEMPVESQGEGRTARPRQPKRRSRFQVIKLEERIAPFGAGNHTQDCKTHGHACTGLGCA